MNEYRRELSRGLAFSRKRKTSRKKLSSFERRPPQVFFFFFPLSLSARFLDSVDGNSSSKKPPFFSGANRHYSRPVVADNAKLAKPARSAAAVFLVVMRRRRLAVRVCDRGHRRSAPADGRRGSGSCGLRRRSGRGGRGQGAVGAGERREDAPGEEGGRHGLELAFFFFLFTLRELKESEQQSRRGGMPRAPATRRHTHVSKSSAPLCFSSRKPSAPLSRIASFLFA